MWLYLLKIFGQNEITSLVSEILEEKVTTKFAVRRIRNMKPT
mgnify:CR=1 FL=1